MNRSPLFSGKRVQSVRSAEEAECGLACLTMIACYYGHDIDLNAMRQRFSLSMSGATLRHLVDAADQIGLGSRALTLEMGAIRALKLPAIVHWRFSHFVVLERVQGSKVIIHDPASGVRHLSITEFSKHFTGVALEIFPNADFAPIVERKKLTLSSLWSSIEGVGSAAFSIFVLSLVLQIFAFAAPFQIQIVVDQAVSRQDVGMLGAIAILFATFLLLQTVFDAARSWTLQLVGQTFSFQVGGNVFRHLLRLPASYFEKRHIGDIITRMRSVDAIQETITKGVISAIIDGGMALAAICLLFIYSPLLAGLVIASVAISVGISAALYPMVRVKNEQNLIASARERTHLLESVRAAAIIKLMGREQERESAWRNLYAAVTGASLDISALQIVQSNLQTLVSGLSSVLIIYFGARSVMAGDGLSLGMLFAILSFKQIFSDRSQAFILQTTQFRLLGMYLDRLGDIVASEAESTTKAPLANFKGRMTFRDVSFRYSDADPWVLRDFSMDILPGEFVAIVGPSGCGKTTLMKLMTGLLAPVEGEILLDGIRATPELWRSWREFAGIASQDDRLLSGTIAENISFFDPEWDLPRVMAAGSSARIHDEIMRMPMQYRSLIGDMGSSLSGGQRQRLIIARVLYRKPQIVLLDEGTANLDMKNERAIASIISAMQITRIVVAHRPMLVSLADRVIDLSAGDAEAIEVVCDEEDLPTFQKIHRESVGASDGP